jgi:hypothetical protein
MQWKERAVVEIARLLRLAMSSGRHTARFLQGFNNGDFDDIYELG